jgi:hypothetical protein
MASATAFARYIAPAEAAPARSSSFFSRALEALKRSRMRAAEEEIARFIELRGGRLTDSVERQIERSFI